MRGGTMENLIERAMALAKSGRHTTIRTLRNELHTEGFTHYELAALSGRELQNQLRALMTQTASARPPDIKPSPPPTSRRQSGPP